MSSSNYTVEHKASVKNGIGRMIISTLIILAELYIIISLFYRFIVYAAWLQVAERVVAIGLILWIHNSNRVNNIKTPWIILIAVLPIIGSSLFLISGLNGATRKMKKRYQAIDADLLPRLTTGPAGERAETALENLKSFSPQLSGLSQHLIRSSFYPVYQNTDILYYDDAAKALEAQKEELRKAEKFIFMEYHAIEDAQSWQGIQEILEERAKAGVEVRVFYDDMGSIGFITMDFAHRLEKTGIQCRVFNPLKPVFNLFLNNRDHRKITIIDGKTGFTGGYNLANEYFHRTEPFGFWKDTGLRLEGNAVNSLTITFLEMWNAVNEKDRDDSDFSKYLHFVPAPAQPRQAKAEQKT